MIGTYLKHLIPVALMTTALSACSGSSPPPSETASANLSGYNHTEDYIHEFYVDGTWGGNVFAYGGGGSFVCCIAYPRQWREGLAAKVRWTTSSSDPEATGDAIKGKWHETVAPIERYTQPGTTLNVHFLPEGKVRLIITSGSAAQPGYPGPPPPVKPKSFKW